MGGGPRRVDELGAREVVVVAWQEMRARGALSGVWAGLGKGEARNGELGRLAMRSVGRRVGGIWVFAS